MGCIESTPKNIGSKHVIPEPEKPLPPASEKIVEPNSESRSADSSLFKEYPLDVLKFATNGFSPGNIVSNLGAEAVNWVYRGRLVDEGRWIALKRFPPDAWPDARGFVREARRVARVRHERLVSLIGCCCEGQERLLVAEYMPNDTLVKHLFQWDKYPMPWDMRVNVALYVIRALNHCAENGLPIYNDLNSDRVLFDQDGLPRLSCFGLMKSSRDGRSYSTDLAYLPPEFVEHGRISPEGVIFSYGTLLVDLLSGKRISPSQALDLIKAKNMRLLMDSYLETQSSDPDGAELVRIAALCLQFNPLERPSGKMLASAVAALQRRASTDRRPSDSTMMSPGEKSAAPPPLELTEFGEVCSRSDLTAMHEMLVKAGYIDDEGTENELSFQVWIKMQEMLNSRKRGDVAFREKDFKAAIDYYTEFVDMETMVSPTVYARRALAYLLLDQPQAALGDAMKAEIVYPKWSTAFYMQAVALTKMGMEGDAHDMLKEGTVLELKRQKKLSKK